MRTPVTQYDEMIYHKGVKHIEADRVYSKAGKKSENRLDLSNLNNEKGGSDGTTSGGGVLEKRK